MTQRARILIVDDESRICNSLASLLGQMGYDVRTAATGQEALELIRKHDFDIGLLDHMLPDMLGCELIDTIHHQNPDSKAIIMTGNASVDSAVKALRKGAYDYLRKPFEFAELTNTVKNALSQQRLKIENRKIQEELTTSQHYYRYLVDNSPDIIYTLDPEGRFTFVNNSMESLLGLPTNELIGQHYSKLTGRNNAKKCKWILNERRTDSRTKSWSRLQLQKFNAFGEPSDEILFTELQSTGMYKESSAAAPRSYLGTHGVIRDITARTLSEKKSNQIKVQLQRAEKMEAVGTLASGVAHDLNNVLSGILGYPELILMDMPEDDPNRNYIQQIQKSGEKAAVIVKDLLTLARRGVEISDVVNLDTIICDYFTSPEYLKLNAAFPKISFNINLNSKQQNIMGSCVHLSKSLMNLLSNAAEAMPDGGRIGVSTRIWEKTLKNQKPLHIPKGRYILLTVTDSGIGIAPKDLKRIFDPFYTKKQMGRSGTGLGMTIVWTTMKDHNGFIDVKSIKGKGSTFRLYFPITTNKPQKETQIDVGLLKGNEESILIVDDMPEQLELARNMLTVLNYRFSFVSSGEKAIEFIRKEPPDLILLDMVLGTGMDGLETYKKIKSIHPEIKVIIISGLSDTSRIEKALELGARQYIKKPYTLKTIGLALKKELNDNPADK